MLKFDRCSNRDHEQKVRLLLDNFTPSSPIVKQLFFFYKSYSVIQNNYNRQEITSKQPTNVEKFGYTVNISIFAQSD